MKKSTPPLIKHNNHNIIIKKVSGNKHYGKYHCVDCDKWVAWVSKLELANALKLGLIDD